jgi:hypothetical protein
MCGLVFVFSAALDGCAGWVDMAGREHGKGRMDVKKGEGNDHKLSYYCHTVQTSYSRLFPFLHFIHFLMFSTSLVYVVTEFGLGSMDALLVITKINAHLLHNCLFAGPKANRYAAD